MMRLWCESCGGLGYNEYPDYDWDGNILDEGIRIECSDCDGRGYVDLFESKDTIQRMAGYIYKLDTDEDICKKAKCRLQIYETDAEECINCIIDFFSNKCKWEHDEFCVNDKSKWVADFAYPSRCGRCDLYEKSK
jgi:hypothetical protein